MKKLLLIFTLVFIGLVFSSMIVMTSDGKEIKVDVEKKDIISIFFSDQTTGTASTETKYIFEDTFDNGNYEKWTGTASKRKIQNGIVEFYSSNHSNFLLEKQNIPYDNVVVEWRGAANRNGFHFNLGPYHFNIGGYGNTGCGYSGPEKPFVQIKTGKIYEPNKFHVYKVTRNGKVGKVFIDGKLIFESDFPKESDKKSGAISFTSHYATLKLDWIKIYKL